MKQYVTLDKRSKKAQREYYAKQRTTWGELNPVTRSCLLYTSPSPRDA